MDKYKLSLISLALVLSSGCASEKFVPIPSYYGTVANKSTIGQAALPDASRYQGEFEAGLFHGKGELSWTNGRLYQGEFKQGLAHGKGVYIFAAGDVYQGEFFNGSLSGHGKIKYKGGDNYQGQFANDLLNGLGVFTTNAGDIYSGSFVDGYFSGSGQITHTDGSVYNGEVKEWSAHGIGVYTRPNRGTYSGHFEAGTPKGQITIAYTNGDSYIGSMDGWDRYHGQGTYTTNNGDIYQGNFDNAQALGVFTVQSKSAEKYIGELQNWQYHGKGLYSNSSGESYEGEFAQGLYSGLGKLTTADQKNYTGEFYFGQFHGIGTLSHIDPNGNKKFITGSWQAGKYVGEDADDFIEYGLTKLNAEQIMFEQAQRVTQAIDQLAPQQANQTDLYFVGFASHGPQDVFMNEVEHAADVISEQYDLKNKTVKLINNHKTLKQYPLATATNLKAALSGLAEKMVLSEDILFLYLTSHGSKEHKLSVKLGELPLQDLSAQQLKQFVDDAGIKWKVIIISACYSGGFIESLKDDNSIIITSASADRPSFGCGDDAELTYFGQAFFQDTLRQSDNIKQAFEKAVALVTQKEIAEGYKPSNPQMHMGTLITDKLNQLKTFQQTCTSHSNAADNNQPINCREHPNQ